MTPAVFIDQMCANVCVSICIYVSVCTSFYPQGYSHGHKPETLYYLAVNNAYWQ